MEDNVGMLETFIENLSYRFRSENDLSDMTWTMCKTDSRFKVEFLKFFFGKLESFNVDDELKEIELIREYTQNDSRPDFKFEYKGKDYLIECKIYDENHHFEQYISEFRINNKQLGYITNYNLQKDGFEVRTWTEFYKYLDEKINDNILDEKEKKLWSVYLKYLKKVCDIFIPKEPMKLDGMYSLYTFYKSLKDVVENEEKGRYKSCLYRGRERKDMFYGGFENTGEIGVYFEIKVDENFKINKSLKDDFNERRTFWGWIGVFLKCDDDDRGVYIGFDNKWGVEVFEYLKNYVKNGAGETTDLIEGGDEFEEPYYDDGCIWFKFNKSDEFDNQKNVDDQKGMLKKFFNGVIEVILNKIERKEC
ncbi:MAG: hypothetical protein IIX03_03310 [Paludibacteraceae bacterium]|nr:hypothetical protein [Paludibacteraceae bacterium]